MLGCLPVAHGTSNCFTNSVASADQTGMLHALSIHSSVATLTICLSVSTNGLYLCACVALWLLGLFFSASHHFKLRHCSMSLPPCLERAMCP